MQKPLTPSQRLTAFTSEFDRIFNHLLGYILAFTSLVAFADVLGNGRITSSLPWLFWLWILAQGLCVEFQVFVLVKRLPSLWTRNRAMFAINLVFIALLCVMSVIIGSVFVEHDQAGSTIETAMSLLGINHIFFVYTRSALAIGLVALIAIDRALEQHEQQQEQQTTRPDTSEHLTREDITAIIRESLASILVIEQQSETLQIAAATPETVEQQSAIESGSPSLAWLESVLPDVSSEDISKVLEAAEQGIPRREICSYLKWGSAKYTGIVKPVLDLVEQQQ